MLLQLRRQGVGARGAAGEGDDEGDDGGLGIACFFLLLTRRGVRKIDDKCNIIISPSFFSLFLLIFCHPK